MILADLSQFLILWSALTAPRVKELATYVFFSQGLSKTL